MKAWHYTTLSVLYEIIKSGVLMPTCYPGADQFRSTLWFSTNPVWEPTSAKRVGLRSHSGGLTMMQRRLTKDEQHAILGLARIEAPPDLELLPFWRWCDTVDAPDEWAMSMMSGGVELGGKPTEWFASFDPLPASRWMSVEVWNGHSWEAHQ
jgi:hypothetical protein